MRASYCCSRSRELRGRKREHVSTGWRGYFDVRSEHRMKAEAFVRMIRHAAQP